MEKVVFYIDCMQMGGANRVMANIATYFAESGHEVLLINDIEPIKDKPEYSIATSIRRVYLDKGNQQKYSKNVNRILSLRKILIQEKPSAIVSFMGPPNIRMLVASIGLSVRKIVSVRNDPYREYGSGLWKIIANIFFLLSDGCVFQTEYAQSYFWGSIRRKSKIICNPIDNKFYSVKWKRGGKDIVVIGRLQPQKNPLLALEAFSKISDIFPDNRLVYYGDDELKDEIIQRSRSACLENRVIVHGKTGHVEDILSNSALYVLTSDFEGLPNALMEAMAVGVPAISTDCPCGGPKSLIKSSKQGLLVECRNVEALADAMKTILGDNKLQEIMSQNERLRAESFREQIVCRQWEEYILQK